MLPRMLVVDNRRIRTLDGQGKGVVKDPANYRWRSPYGRCLKGLCTVGTTSHYARRDRYRPQRQYTYPVSPAHDH